MLLFASWLCFLLTDSTRSWQTPAAPCAFCVGFSPAPVWNDRPRSGYRKMKEQGSSTWDPCASWWISRPTFEAVAAIRWEPPSEPRSAKGVHGTLNLSAIWTHSSWLIRKLTWSPLKRSSRDTHTTAALIPAWWVNAANASDSISMLVTLFLCRWWMKASFSFSL